MIQIAGVLIDGIYCNEFVTFGVGVVIAALVVFSDLLSLSNSYTAACFILIATLMMYEDNPTIAFMVSAFVVGTLSPHPLPKGHPAPLDPPGT